MGPGTPVSTSSIILFSCVQRWTRENNIIELDPEGGQRNAPRSQTRSASRRKLRRSTTRGRRSTRAECPSAWCGSTHAGTTPRPSSRRRRASCCGPPAATPRSGRTPRLPPCVCPGLQNRGTRSIRNQRGVGVPVLNSGQRTKPRAARPTRRRALRWKEQLRRVPILESGTPEVRQLCEIFERRCRCLKSECEPTPHRLHPSSSHVAPQPLSGARLSGARSLRGRARQLPRCQSAQTERAPPPPHSAHAAGPGGTKPGRDAGASKAVCSEQDEQFINSGGNCPGPIGLAVCSLN
eukprot:SAG31_NODE_3205_length_4555_cov_4.933348_1_plen_294_part_00